MPLSVKGAGIGGLIVVVRILADGRPFLRRRVAGAGSIGSVRVKCTVVEDDVVHQLGTGGGVLCLAARTVDKRKMSMADIKNFGTYTAEVKLYNGITAKLYVEVGE